MCLVPRNPEDGVIKPHGTEFQRVVSLHVSLGTELEPSADSLASTPQALHSCQPRKYGRTATVRTDAAFVSADSTLPMWVNPSVGGG